MTKRKCNPESQEARELLLFAVNDGDLYRQRITPIIANVKKKIKKGTYDATLALKLWRYAADAAATKYTKEFDTPHRGSSFGIFTVPMRNEVAALMQAYYEDELRYAENPSPRVTEKQLETLVKRINEAAGTPLEPYVNVAGKFTAQVGNYHLSGAYGGWKLEQITNAQGGTRDITYGYVPKRDLYEQLQAILTGSRLGLHKENPSPRIGTAHPKRRSAITKKTPSKRLVARRKANVKKGYFPNPLLNKSNRSIASIKHSPFGTFVVLSGKSQSAIESLQHEIATFVNQREALKFAEWWAKNNPEYFVGVYDLAPGFQRGFYK